MVKASSDAPGDGRSAQTSALRAFLREARGVRTQSWGNPLGYLFIAPAISLYLVFNFWVLIRGFLMAFTNYQFLVPGSSWAWNGLRNFELMFRDHFFWASLVISIKYILMVLPSNVIIALIVALFIFQARRGGGFVRWLVYLPTILPIAVSMLLWQQLYNDQYGYVDAMLRGLGMVHPPNWLGDPGTVLPAVAVASIWRSFGFATLLFLVGLYGIAGDLYEAAAIDGATSLQQLWHITMPLLRPTLALIIVLQIPILYGTAEVLLLTGGTGGPENAAQTVGFYIFQVAFSEGNLRMGYAAALSLVIGLAMSGITIFTLRFLRGEAA